MKITEHIQRLQEILAEHGDLQVNTDGYQGRIYNSWPEIAYKKQLRGREHVPVFWDSLVHAEVQKGEKVVRV